MKFKIFYILFLIFVFGCHSLSGKYVDVNDIIVDAYSSYSDLNADGMDINAMLSYLCLKIATNRVDEWDTYYILINDYLLMAENDHISPNYIYTAGSNEVVVVSNFFYNLIGYYKWSRSSFRALPSQLFSVSQSLATKINKSEFKKDEQ